MNVLIVASWYPKSEQSIRGVFFREQARALQRAGHCVSVIVSERDSFFRSKFLDFLHACTGKPFILENDNGISIYRNKRIRFFPIKLFPLHAKRIIVRDSINFFAGLDPCVKKYDIIHAQSVYWAGAVADTLSRVLNVPYIVQEHRSNFLSNKIPESVKKESRYLFSRATIVTAVSSRLLEVLRTNYSVPVERSTVLENMVSKCFFIDKPRKISNGVRFCIVARLHHRKRVDLILAAFCEFVQHYNNAELHIIGNGPLRQDLEDIAKQKEINNRIVWHGEQSPAYIAELFRSFDVLLLSSDHETFGVVLAEAWASGIPVVATRCGGPDSLVKPYNGILVEKGSHEALLAGMLEFIRRRKDFDSNYIRQKAFEEFGEEAIVNKTIGIYTEAIQYYREMEKNENLRIDWLWKNKLQAY